MKMITYLLLLLAPLCQAQDHHQGHDHDPDPKAVSDTLMSQLSPSLQALLVSEMQMLEQGMSQLGKHIPKGEWQTVAQIAEQMRDSYIIKKQLTPAHKQELSTKLPEGFRHMDQQFHQTAGKLVHTAHKADAELSVFYFSAMVESCVGCHTHYASTKFPGLTPVAADHAH